MYDKEAELIMESIIKFKHVNKNFSQPKEMPFNEMRLLGIINMLYQDKPEDYKVKMSEISERMPVSKPAITQMVNKLEDMGMLIRLYDKSDRRATYIQLTERGQKEFENEKKCMIENTKMILEKMGEEDSKEFIRLVRKLYNIMCEEGDRKC